jgi:hypothetical protein
MRKETYIDNGTTWQRITRNKAEKAYNEGHKIALCPVNIRADSLFDQPIPVTNSCGRTFRAIVNEFEAYNCNGETGKYAKFFMEV